ncbi:DUF1129 family protein [Facklamia sp. DSM 111018]|uniref:DUF1129 family protein n=1 Tax=Facklamia lactis TaxID=2749967 RepID=A0ABS0LT40_9LACT|nr:DUF1129 family protein [Facklamia lactis]MBG9981286.1 DUF1129 family protein [Facklamia lactis]MBG9987237.1 DUF1129 family protein [Facklamia lactis]
MGNHEQNEKLKEERMANESNNQMPFDQDENQNTVIAGVTNTEWDQLTKRNRQFLFDIDKHLSTENIDASVKSMAFSEMAQTLIEGQRTGHTARQIYGTPTETADAIRQTHSTKSEELEKSPDWQIAIDGGLMLGSIFTIITGFTVMMGKSGTAQQGFLMGGLTLIINYLVAGYAMMETAKVLPNPDAPKGEKGYAKYFLVSTATMVLWIGLVMFSQYFLPRIINPILPALVYLIIGGISLLLRFYLKNKWKIEGGLF